MTRTRIFSALIIATIALTACAKPGDRMKFDGKYYPTRSKKAGDEREQFVVTVKRVDQGIEGARKAGKWEATRFCIETVGDSTLNWQPGYDPDAGAAVIEGGSLILRGSCAKW
ncbi:hypothetical protein OO012_01975 [Rhodobacteraceae bacterium KMM 6894]|nr:hypothetical protein [Rhodobacteraceae bacterium KMM 6894]